MKNKEQLWQEVQKIPQSFYQRLVELVTKRCKKFIDNKSQLLTLVSHFSKQESFFKDYSTYSYFLCQPCSYTIYLDQNRYQRLKFLNSSIPLNSAKLCYFGNVENY